MNREHVEPASLEEVAGFVVSSPMRFSFKGPRAGGPNLGDIRRVLAKKGKLRITATATRVFCDVDPGEAEKPLIALDMIARSDAEGLERAILSAVGQVDEIIVGVDGRSDEDTRKVAEAYADTVYVFQAADIGLSDEDWKKDKIHFANARNLGRARVVAPWTLVIDTDEYLRLSPGVDLRQAIRDDAGASGSLQILVLTEDGGEQQDCQRLTRTEYRWWSDTHNQLVIPGNQGKVGATIYHDRALRRAAEVARRDVQREQGIDGLEEEAAKGNLNALYHLAKHRLSLSKRDVDVCVRLIEDYRLRTEIHGPLAQQRAMLALGMASVYYNLEDGPHSELWCIRSLLDGPRVDTFCLLGDLAEERGDYVEALGWYDAACALPEPPPGDSMGWRTLIELRWGRREGLRQYMAKEKSNGVADSKGAAPDLARGQTDPGGLRDVVANLDR